MTEELEKPAPWKDEKGKFLVGHTGIGGRPKGSRNALGEAMIADLCADWLEHGMQAVRRVREERPADYLKVVALLVSKAEGFGEQAAVTIVNVITRGK